jgi:hypothetical protein
VLGDNLSMEPTKKLIDPLFRDRVLRARQTPPEEKLLDGPRLFDYACRITAAGIRNENPSADDSRVRQLLKERIQLGRRLEEHRLGVWRDANDE